MLTIDEIESFAKEATQNPKAWNVNHASNTLGDLPGNLIRSRAEVWKWYESPPDSAFIYIREVPENERRLGDGRFLPPFEAITWMGDHLGNVLASPAYRCNMGDRRRAITLIGTNRRIYVGTYFQSAGNYARVKFSPRQTALHLKKFPQWTMKAITPR